MLEIDGSRGEGGGQVLRTSLGLSLLTGTPFRIERIRGGRGKPGLLAQHLAAVEAAAAVGDADVEGAAMHSRRLRFAPREVRPGRYRFRIGTAGSTGLVLQAVLPALLTADGPSELVIEGGTHNAWAPPFEFLQRSYFPVLEAMGPRVRAELERPGFHPAGGGAIRVSVEPRRRLLPVHIIERWGIRRRRARAVVARLPRHVAEREVEVLQAKLGWPEECFEIEEVGGSRGPGNVVIVEAGDGRITEVFTGFGSRGVRAERVAEGVAAEAIRWIESGVPVGEHLADQILLPFAQAGGGAYRTLAPTRHFETNAAIIERFLDSRIRVREEERGTWRVEVVHGDPEEA